MFGPHDLAELERLLASASAVVSMREIHAGNHEPAAIGLRHDVDWDLATAARIAEWEAERGYRSTYFILHTAPYWQDRQLMRDSLDWIAACGHEIGFHLDALAAALINRRDPVAILDEAVSELRSYGHEVVGVVGHGNAICHVSEFANDEIFSECERPSYGAPDRTLTYGSNRLPIRPVSFTQFGFTYEAVRLPHAAVQSDSGGEWYEPLARTVANFPPPGGQLHILWHPDWWSEALPAAVPVAV